VFFFPVIIQMLQGVVAFSKFTTTTQCYKKSKRGVSLSLSLNTTS